MPHASFNTRLLLFRKWWSKLDWPGKEPIGAPCLSSQVWDFTQHHMPGISAWVLGIEFRSWSWGKCFTDWAISQFCWTFSDNMQWWMYRKYRLLHKPMVITFGYTSAAPARPEQVGHIGSTSYLFKTIASSLSRYFLHITPAAKHQWPFLPASNAAHRHYLLFANKPESLSLLVSNVNTQSQHPSCALKQWEWQMIGR